MTRISLTAHPAQVGEGYFQHLCVATGFGTRMILGGLACLVHGVLPFLCTTSGSRTITSLHERMVVSRKRLGTAQRSG